MLGENLLSDLERMRVKGELCLYITMEIILSRQTYWGVLWVPAPHSYNN